jgi:hypothetical protein
LTRHSCSVGQVHVSRNSGACYALFQRHVLRCQGRATEKFVVDQGEGGLYETMV